jgi:proton-coupled amino acid transporter
MLANSSTPRVVPPKTRNLGGPSSFGHTVRYTSIKCQSALNSGIILSRRKLLNTSKSVVINARFGRSNSTPLSAASESDSGETAAIVNTTKAIFGAGGFALPLAFAQGGLVLVGSCMVASLVFALESLRMIVKAQDVLVEAKLASVEEVSTYAGLTKLARGTAGDVLCRVMNVITCFGITVSYLIFIAETCKVVVPAMIGPAMFGAAPTTTAMLQLIAPSFLLLSWLRQMSGVNLISAVGTASVGIGMLVTTITALTSGPLHFAALPTANFSAFPGFFGTVAFLFFIHFTLSGIQEAMPQREKFYPAAVKAFTLSAAIAVVFGVAGAVGFGPSVASVVVTMLTGPPGIMVQLLLCLNLISTYPIMAQSALRICENVFEGGKPGSLRAPQSIAVRSTFTLGAMYTAANVPNFGLVLGYVGGVCCSMLSLVLPAAILYLCQKKVKNEILTSEIARIAGVAGVGLTCMVLSIVL